MSEERSGREGRRHRERRALGQCSAQPGRALAQRPADGCGAGEDPEDCGKAQLPADIAQGARIERQGHGGGEQERVPARARPVAERGDDAGRTHDPGALDRRTTAGDRDVDGDREQDPGEACPARDPEHSENRAGEDREQDDVLTTDREQMRESGGLELIDRRRVDTVVLAEDEAAQERGGGCLGPATERLLGAGANAVEQAGEATARSLRALDAARREDVRDPEAAQVVALPVGRIANRSDGAKAAAGGEVADGLRCEQEDAAVGGVSAHADFAGRAAGHCGDRPLRPHRCAAGQVEGSSVDRIQPRRTDRESDARYGEGEQRQPADRAGTPRPGGGPPEGEERQAERRSPPRRRRTAERRGGQAESQSRERGETPGETERGGHA